MAISVKLENDLSELVVKATDEAIAKALETCGLIAEGYGKQYLTVKGAVDTGRLRNSVTHTVEGKTAYIGTNVEYAPYIEYGTSKMKPRTYLKPSIADHVDQYKDIIALELKRSIQD